jgi:hypothetical protein
MKPRRAIVTVGDNPDFIKATLAAIESLGFRNMITDKDNLPKFVDYCGRNGAIIIQPPTKSSLETSAMCGRGPLEYYQVNGSYDPLLGGPIREFHRFDARTEFAELIAYLTEKPKQWAFWNNDMFPYVDYSEVIGKGDKPGYVKAKDYPTEFKPRALMDEDSAKELIEKIKAVQRKQESAKRGAYAELQALMPWRKL